ncbi:MAG: PIN domain-containing protein [Solirubrobacterales bacterium]
MPIDWRAADEYEHLRDEAETRISARDPDDWLTLALAIALDMPVWSQDKGLRRSWRPSLHHRGAARFTARQPKRLVQRAVLPLRLAAPSRSARFARSGPA